MRPIQAHSKHSTISSIIQEVTRQYIDNSQIVYGLFARRKNMKKAEFWSE